MIQHHQIEAFIQILSPNLIVKRRLPPNIRLQRLLLRLQKQVSPELVVILVTTLRPLVIVTDVGPNRISSLPLHEVAVLLRFVV